MKRYARDVAARPVEAGDEPKHDGVAANYEDNGNGRSRRLCGTDRWGPRSRDDYGYSVVDQIGRQCGEPIVLTVRVAVFDRNVPAFGIAGFAQPFSER